LVVLALAFTACNKDDDHKNDKEGNMVRLMAGDAANNDLHFINPYKKETKKIQLTHPDASIYSGESGKYGYIFHRTNNAVQIIDSGITEHGDHADFISEPQLLSRTLDIQTPGHFSALNGWVIIFNDGDGSVSLFEERHIVNNSYTPRKVQISPAHQGGAVPLDNNRFAVTVKEEGTQGSLPQKVKIIDSNGATIATPGNSAAGIRGAASNGTWGAFGSTDGLLAVKGDGTAKVVTNIAPLENTEGKWMEAVLGHRNLPNHFFGHARNLGIFKVDVNANTITHVLPTEGNTIFSHGLDQDGEQLFVMMRNGSMKILNAITGAEVKEITGLFPPYTEGPAPSFAVSKFHIFIADPASGEISAYKRSDFTFDYKMNTQGKPLQLRFLGSSMKGGDH
jgi:hypothetical protein